MYIQHQKAKRRILYKRNIYIRKIYIIIWIMIFYSLQAPISVWANVHEYFAQLTIWSLCLLHETYNINLNQQVSSWIQSHNRSSSSLESNIHGPWWCSHFLIWIHKLQDLVAVQVRKLTYSLKLKRVNGEYTKGSVWLVVSCLSNERKSQKLS